MSWTKEADWLPVSNAVAQVVFWKNDLQKAEKWLSILESNGVPETSEMWRVSKADIIVSKKGLEKAQIKLKETYKRVFNKEI